MQRTMKAMVATSRGGPDVLRMLEVPLTWPAGPGDVLVRLAAAGVNPADAYFREEGPYIESSAPLILGHDGAGVVEEMGPGARAFSQGDEVCFCNGGIGGAPGTYAEYAVVPEEQLIAKPPSLSFAEAAAAPLALITLTEALQERAGVQPGETVLIHGGAGGTGHVGIQFACLAGARVAATVSDGKKAAFVRELGAELAINYREEDFAQAALEWTEGRGLDVALDNVGGTTMQRTFTAMAPYGRVVTLMGLVPDTEDETAYVSNLTILNVMMLTPMWRGLRERLREQARMAARGLALMAEGKLRVHVEATYPLIEAAEAHRALAAGGMRGKVVLLNH